MLQTSMILWLSSYVLVFVKFLQASRQTMLEDLADITSSAETLANMTTSTTAGRLTFCTSLKIEKWFKWNSELKTLYLSTWKLV
jgi:hypothetical protein